MAADGCRGGIPRASGYTASYGVAVPSGGTTISSLQVGCVHRVLRAAAWYRADLANAHPHRQIALAAASSLLTAAVSLGFGMHSEDIIGSHWSRILLFTNASGFGTILAALWSKTSFALTMLRISEGWTKRFIYFVIITVNPVLGANAVIQWVQCWPPEKQWHPSFKGTCWPARIIIGYNTFFVEYVILQLCAMLPQKLTSLVKSSILRQYGHYSGPASMEHHLEGSG